MKEMMDLAEKAVDEAREFGVELDYTAESLEPLDMLTEAIFRINRDHPLSEHVLLWLANIYGAYLGEVLLRSGLKDLDYAWTENEEGEIGIGKKGVWMAPLSKVYRRITEGPENDLMTFFEVMFGLSVGAIGLDDSRLNFLSEEAI